MDKDSKEAKEYQERLAQEKEAQDKTTAATPVNQAQSQTTLQDLDLSKLENIYTLKVAENTNLQQMLQDYKNNPAV